MTTQSLLLTLIPVVTILVNLLKPLVKAIPGGNSDGIIQLLAAVLSVALVFGFARALGILTPQSALELFVQAVSQGVASVGFYHVMTPAPSAPADPPPAPAPVPPLAPAAPGAPASGA